MIKIFFEVLNKWFTLWLWTHKYLNEYYVSLDSTLKLKHRIITNSNKGIPKGKKLKERFEKTQKFQLELYFRSICSIAFNI